jgi:hypothetical protein
MTWFKVDDTLAFHRKAVAAGNAAMGLWVRAGSWCSQQLTDGFVPDDMIASLGNSGQAKRLVAAGLWERVDGGYRFWQWDERQPSREQVEQERNAARERMRRVRTQKRNGSAEQKGERSGDVRANERRTAPEREPVNNSVNDALTENQITVNGVTHQRGGVQPEAEAEPHDSQVTGSGSGEQDAKCAGTSGDVRPPRPDPTRPEGTGSVGESSSRRNARATDDDDRVIQTIIDVLGAETGRAVEPEWAERVRRQILTGRTPNDPAAYVAACIRGAPRNYLPTGSGDPSSRSVAEALAVARGEA